MKVVQSLSDLVIYTTSVKFISFSHSKDNQNCYENTSIGEKKAGKLIKVSGKMTLMELDLCEKGAEV